MQKKTYHDLNKLLNMIKNPERTACKLLNKENQALFKQATGSTHNHQAWGGGYLDHIQESMNIALVLYRQLNTLRKLPFSLSDALLILFVHDLEKPWMYGDRKEKFIPKDKADRQQFRTQKLKDYKIKLNKLQQNALLHVEGEITPGAYSSNKRAMNELAAFCHICDTTSARLWYNHPLVKNDTWGKRQQ